jgi:hypothetical protein
MTTTMNDTLLFRVKALRKPGIPVVYANIALPSVTGSGVLVAPRDADDEEAEHLLWWEGELQDAAPSVTRTEFNRLVGPEAGSHPGHSVRACVPWLLEIDFSKPEGRAAALAWLHSTCRTILTLDSSPEAIRQRCWSHVPEHDLGAVALQVDRA